MIDWAPTLLSYFGKKVPGDMQGHDLADTIRSDKRVRDYAIFGVFSGHVNITDGSYVYMRAPLPKKANDIYNYTLMPLHMNQRFTVGELRTAQLTEPFSFTKGCRLLKIKAKDKFKVGRFGTLLFDIRTDPEERYPVKDSETEKRMCKAMIEEMRKNDSPKEQFERLGLHKEEDGQ